MSTLQQHVVDITLPAYLEEAIVLKIGAEKTPALLLDANHDRESVHIALPPLKQVAANFSSFIPRLEFPEWWALKAKDPSLQMPLFSLVIVNAATNVVVYYAVNVPANSTARQYGDIVFNFLLQDFQTVAAPKIYNVYLFPQNNTILSVVSEEEIQDMYDELPNTIIIEEAEDNLTGARGRPPMDIYDFMQDHVGWNVGAFEPTQLYIHKAEDTNTSIPVTQTAASRRGRTAKLQPNSSSRGVPRNPFLAIQQQAAETMYATPAELQPSRPEPAENVYATPSQWRQYLPQTVSNPMVVMPSAPPSFASTFGAPPPFAAASATFASAAAPPKFSQARPKKVALSQKRVGATTTTTVAAAPPFTHAENVTEGDAYFLPQYRNQLSERNKKACRMALHILAKGIQPHIAYATAAKQFGRYPGNCAEHFDFEAFTDEYLRGFARGHSGVDIPVPWDREEQLYNIALYLSRSKKESNQIHPLLSRFNLR